MALPLLGQRRRHVDHRRARAGATLYVPLGRQLRVRVHDDTPRHAEILGENPGRRQGGSHCQLTGADRFPQCRSQVYAQRHPDRLRKRNQQLGRVEGHATGPPISSCTGPGRGPTRL